MRASDLVRCGFAMHQRRDLEQAERLYRLALAQDEGHPDALHLLGMIMLDRGEAALAADLIGRAVKRAPRSSAMQSNLGNALRAIGRTVEALSCYQTSVRLDPRHAAAHHNLGQLLRSLGRPSEAVPSLETAVRLDPQDLRAVEALAEAMMQAQDFAGADRVLEAQLERTPHWANGCSLRGAAQALQDRIDAALEWLDRAIALEPGEARHLAAKGAWLLKARRIEAAARALQTALQLDAGQAQTWNDMGRALRAKGDLAGARNAFETALQRDAAHIDARRNLALLGGSDAASHLGELLDGLATGRLSIEDRLLSEFAIGKLLEDDGCTKEAFAHYTAGNEMALKSRRIDRRKAARSPAGRLAALLQAANVALDRPGLADQTPVFIVGLPRSGTSLVEQILASHSQAFGAGELSRIGELFSRRNEAVDRQALARDYVSALKDVAPQSIRISDKMPGNIYFVDFISELIDRPRVIFCTRHPLDAILSCYFQSFSSGNEFSYDLKACASRWLEADEIARAWLASPRLNAIEMRYEALVDDLEPQSRRLIAFLDLPWEEACLDFHKTQRVVATASGWQVRQPLYRRSVGR